MDRICAAITAVARDRCPDMEDMAQVVANKHGKALLLFSKCHQHFNSSTKFTNEMLPSLRRYYMCITHTCTLYYVWCLYLFCPESDIDEFLQHYRTTFPTATITPKLHMIEGHVNVVDFIGEWGVGIGMLGEQGAESIHTVFNQLARTYDMQI